MISIIIPCYNHRNEVRRAVDSALNQKDFPKDQWEIIVVDDGSNPPIEDAWSDKVTVLRHSYNAGLPVALNTGVRESKGDRFVILAADDALHPTYLSLMSQHDNDIVSCNMIANGKHVHARPGSVELLKKGNCHSYAALVKRKVFDLVGGFKETMNPSWEDWEFWLNSAKHGAQWSHVNMPLHLYNRNPVGRDVKAQSKERLLKSKFSGYHQDLYGKGDGVVGFVIPCYNHEEFVRDAVFSVHNQIYPHVVACVVDDGSPGNIKKALKDVDVDILRQKNKGLSGARNAGIKFLLDKYNVEFLVMLDADDKVSPDFVEHTLGYMRRDNDFVYTDVQFFGGAWHRENLKAFKCNNMLRKHQHPCTFLMRSQLWKDVVEMRGHGYDENMKEGYEDWEFSIAAVEAGYCGLHLNKHLFFYRHHPNGSMRTAASKVKDKLGNYIRQKHEGRKELLRMACDTCGGGHKFTSVTNNSVNIAGLGELSPGAPIKVTYKGTNKATQTKIGRGGRIYNYSGNPNGTYKPVFFAAAEDVDKFEGPFTIEAVEAEEPSPQQDLHPVAVPTPVTRPMKAPQPKKPSPAPKVEKVSKVSLQEALEKSKSTTTTKKVVRDDFTQINGVGPKGAIKLVEAGFDTFDDILEVGADELGSRLGLSSSVAKKVYNGTRELVESNRNN